MPLNKPALRVLNNTNFPNNNAQYISPALLREFNDEMITSMELTQSMSEYAQLSGGNAFIGSQSIDGYVSIDKTKALNTNAIYWNSNVVGYTNLEIVNTSTNGNVNIGAIGGKVQIVSSSLNITNGTFTASLENGFTYVGNGSGRTQAVSTSSFASNINTGSFLTTSSFNAYTSSNDTKWNTLGGQTGSFVTSAITASSLITASFSGNTLTFTKGDSSTFGVVIPDVSGSNINTGSLMVTGSVSGNILTFTKGDSSQFSLTVATGSGGGGSTDTGSLLVTASFNNTTRNITFTKGDASQFNISGFATTGSNSGNNRFIGEQQISSSLNGLTMLGYGNRLNFGDTSQADRAFLFLAESDGTNQGTTLNFTGANTGILFGINDTATPSTGSTPVSFENTSRSGSILFLNSGNTGTIKFDNATGSIQLKAGSSISISGSSTTIQDVNFIPFSASLNSRILAVTGSSINTGSLMTTGSVSGNVLTFTKGDASTFTLTVATGSGGGGSTFSNPSVESISGSLLLTANTFTSGSANLLHLSASAQNQANLVFKNNSTTGDTIISGSNNIFTNPAAVTTGYKRYIGGSNNIYLNNSNGINSQITQSATTVSGARPTMNNNIFNGTGNFSINQAPNPGTHTYSQNIIGGTGTTTINALGFTGSLNLQSNFNNNGTITINAASASTAEIASGLSGSGTITMNNNGLFGGTITNTSPRILLTSNTQTVSSNVIAGTSITITNISGSANVNASNNITNGAISYTNANATGVHTSVGGVSTSYGAFTVLAVGSAVSIANALSLGGPTINNTSISGSAGAGLMSANRNLFQGQTHTISVTGSLGTASGVNFSDNSILGRSNTIFSNVTGAGGYRDLNGCIIAGQNLIVTASNSFTLTEGGSGHFGRYNVNDGIRNKTGEMVFSVGTGISSARKTGFLIDSGSNTFVEGSFNVSGSSNFNGNVSVTGSLLVNGSSVSINTGSFATTGSNSFNGNQTITGSVKIIGATTISGSLTQSGSVSIQGETTFVNKNGTTTSVILGQFAMSEITGSVAKSVAIGQGAMRYASGSDLDSIAIGFNTLAVTTGVNNFALGGQALAENTSGGQNTAIGTGALNKNTTGTKNTGIGDGAGFTNISGSNNTYIGPSAGNNLYGDNNLLLGGYQGVGEIVNNNIILSTGGGNIKAQYNETAWLMKAPVNFTTGSNQQAGTAVLDGGNPGTVTVSNSLVTANSIIMLTKQTLTNSHMVAVSSKGAGTFTITSNGNGDADTVGWFIINNS
jgi:hypothetical protein